MFVAYCDESYSGDLSKTPLYVVAGLCAPVRSWSAFDTYWRATMRELRIEQLGLHASKCANGAGPYAGMSAEVRHELQYRLIVDIVASKPIMGFAAVIESSGFNEHAGAIRKELGRDLAKFHVPHVAAMEVCVELISQILEDVVTDRIAFIFDRNKEFGRRAAEWYQMNVDRPLGRHHLKLGNFQERDRTVALGLQAADMLAYAAFRHFKNPDSSCWQWRELNQGVRVANFVVGSDFWSAPIEPDQGMSGHNQMQP